MDECRNLDCHCYQSDSLRTHRTFAASLMDRWGLRRLVLCALVLLTVSVGLTTLMKSQWQLVLLWGVCVGSGTGVTSLVLAAVIANRWFDKHRGLFGRADAANATGQLLVVLARLLERFGWRSVSWVVAGSAAVVFMFVFALMRDRPSEMALEPYGRINDGDRSRYCRAITTPHRRSAPRHAFARFLGTGRQLLCLWREHEWADRHSSDPGMS